MNNVVAKQADIYFHMTGTQNANMHEHLAECAKQIGDTFYGRAAIMRRSNWKEAFEDLTQAIHKVPADQKIVLFFDELPWMATPRSKLLQALDFFWNRYWSLDPRIKLIVCGSATSWIIEKIINNKGGLHNRVTRSLHIRPFKLHEIELFLKAHQIHLKHKQILNLYAVMGGVPLYWTLLRKGQSAHQCIEELCFESEGTLVNEFDRLFDSLFGDSKPYKDLIRIIASHRHGIGQAKLINEAKAPDGGSTVKRLTQLEQAGFIISLVPYGHKDKGVYYLIEDEYSLFYLTWIEPKMRTIMKAGMNKGYWLSTSDKPAWKTWISYAFESICYKHIDQVKHALKIDPGAEPGTWRYVPRKKDPTDGVQIDLLFDRRDDVISLCEIKYTNKPFAIDKSYAKEILRKMDVFQKRTKTNKQLFFSMITCDDLKPTMYSEELITNEITLKDLFEKI